MTEDERNPVVEKPIVAIKDEDSFEVAAESAPSFTDGEGELLCGYTDENGNVHKTFGFRDINGMDEEEIAKAKNSGNDMKTSLKALERSLLYLGDIVKKEVGNEAFVKILRKLYIYDLDFMLMSLRTYLVGGTLQFKAQCPVCGTRLDVEEETSNLEIMPFDGVTSKSFELSKGFGLTTKDGIINKGTVRMPVVADIEAIYSVLKINPVKGTTILLSRVCKFDNGAFMTEDFLRKLSMKERKKLQEVLMSMRFGIVPHINVDCSECGRTIMLQVGEAESFLG